ncbi:MAG: OadG family protein [Oscillospiraceae bacterium]|nr:OadG family protein [Oscillospiraceae bacterium]
MAPDSPIVLTILGMGTVLIVLYLINIMIVVMGKVLAPKTVPVAPAVPAAPAYNQEEEETLAVIMAAVTSVVGSANIASIDIKPKQ